MLLTQQADKGFLMNESNNFREYTGNVVFKKTALPPEKSSSPVIRNAVHQQ
jgi:hypothetical protein